MRSPILAVFLPICLTLAAGVPAANAQDSACTIRAGLPEPVAAPTDRLHEAPEDVQRRAHFAGHGQLVFGSERIFISHLPVFMDDVPSHPHNFQVILEVDFDNAGARDIYRNDAVANADAFYTTIPARFVLTDLVGDANGSGPLRSLTDAGIRRGHFEKGGTTIASTDLTVENVVYFREFDAERIKLDGMAYVLFGNGMNHFASHAMSAPADFDQTLAITVAPADGAPDDDRATIATATDGAWMEIAGRDNNESVRLAAGDILPCTVVTSDGTSLDVTINVEREVYCEAGEFDTVVRNNDFNDFRDCR